MQRPCMGPAGRALLTELASARTLVAFDFDGTLAPIVDDHHAAHMSAATEAALAAVARAWPVAIISGRARADVAARVGPAALLAVVGNHGLEPCEGGGGGELAAARAALAELLALPGVELEDKGRSLAIHYRRAPDRASARRAIRRAVGRLEGVRLVPGKLLVNVLPASGPDKGAALERLLAEHMLDHVLFVGDDVTDESVFERAAREPRRWVGVRVGRAMRSAAAWYLRDQRDIDRLLVLLVGLRAASSP